MAEGRDFWSECGKEFKNIMEKSRADIREEIAIAEREDCIFKTIKILQELEIDKETIIQKIQKYWDLRRSEAEWFLDEIGRNTCERND